MRKNDDKFSCPQSYDIVSGSELLSIETVDALVTRMNEAFGSDVYFKSPTSE